jgi:Cu+-exporting ATPase
MSKGLEGVNIMGETTVQLPLAAVCDPVCGMMVDPAGAAATRTYAGETLYFCSASCAQQFDHEHIDHPPTVVNTADLVNYARAGGYSVETAAVVLGIQGMYCSSCPSVIEEALLNTPGVLFASVNAATEEAHIEYIAGLAGQVELIAAIEAAGFTVV